MFRPIFGLCREKELTIGKKGAYNKHNFPNWEEKLNTTKGSEEKSRQEGYATESPGSWEGVQRAC